MRWLGVFLCPLAGMLVHGIGYFSFSIKFAIALIYTIGLREALWEWKVFPKNPTQMTCTSWPRVHKATTLHFHIKQIIWQLVESPLIIWGWVFYDRKIDDFASLSVKLWWLYGAQTKPKQLSMLSISRSSWMCYSCFSTNDMSGHCLVTVHNTNSFSKLTENFLNTVLSCKKWQQLLQAINNLQSTTLIMKLISCFKDFSCEILLLRPHLTQSSHYFCGLTDPTPVSYWSFSVAIRE